MLRRTIAVVSDTVLTFASRFGENWAEVLYFLTCCSSQSSSAAGKLGFEGEPYSDTGAHIACMEVTACS